ncbi:cytochrome P450 [Lentithecium fluviatile CBS 122367]|uniref:Cytochrome P450 n=1 Tax=Lentithecium fluviatile CBS 122367 TaxID=1168545 RepID=A0A6G1JJH2_9PLEO|nr:cytochrome P450 [Lentithecium fluviatile CBS 122367]
MHNVTLHPLARLPGPRWRAAFYFPFFYEIWTGDVVSNWHKLHEESGDIVRISPTCVSFPGRDAWEDIYGQTANKRTFVKGPFVYAPPVDGVADVHLDLFIQKLHEKAALESTVPVDLVRWFSFITFDIIGDLCFGQTFGGLENEEYNSWIASTFKSLKFVRMFSLFPAFQKARQKHMQYTWERTARRTDDVESTREDIMTHILRHNGERGMSREENKNGRNGDFGGK